MRPLADKKYSQGCQISKQKSILCAYCMYIVLTEWGELTAATLLWLYTGAVDFGRGGFPRIISVVLSQSLGFCTQVLLTLGGEDFLESYLLLFLPPWSLAHWGFHSQCSAWWRNPQLLDFQHQWLVFYCPPLPLDHPQTPFCMYTMDDRQCQHWHGSMHLFHRPFQCEHLKRKEKLNVGFVRQGAHFIGLQNITFELYSFVTRPLMVELALSKRWRGLYCYGPGDLLYWVGLVARYRSESFLDHPPLHQLNYDLAVLFSLKPEWITCVATCHIRYISLSLCWFFSQVNSQNTKILEVRLFRIILKWPPT